MSSGLGIDYAADHAEQELDREITVKFRGRSIPAIASIPERTREFEDDTTGFYRTAVWRVSMRDAAIPNQGANEIEEGELITYGKTNFRVANVTHDDEAAITLCDCESEAQ